MSVDVVTEARIARPRAEVAAFACDPDNATRWYENIKSVRWETPPPLTVGSRIAFVARFLGRPLAYTYEVREHAVAGERVRALATGEPFDDLCLRSPLPPPMLAVAAAGSSRTSPRR